MEQKRKSYHNQLSEEAKSHRRTIVMNLRSIESIKEACASGKDPEFFKTRVENTESSIMRCRDLISSIEKKMKDVMDGLLDDELQKLSVEAQKEMIEKNGMAEKREMEAKESLGQNRIISKAYEKSQRDDSFRTKDMDWQYKKLLDITDTLPEYIAKYLPSMPNNKGYRWRGAIFFGEMQAERGKPLTIFEKKHDGTFITEITPTSEIVWFKSKNSNAPKKLISSKKRTQNVNGSATLSS